MAVCTLTASVLPEVSTSVPCMTIYIHLSILNIMLQCSKGTANNGKNVMQMNIEVVDSGLCSDLEVLEGSPL